MSSNFTLAVCSEMVFLDLPHIERVKKIHSLGFAVEIWDWTRKDIASLAATGAIFAARYDLRFNRTSWLMVMARSERLELPTF